MPKAITRTYWSEQDYNFLREKYLVLSYKEIGEKLGKTKSAVQNKLRVLGLSRPDKYSYNQDFFENILSEEQAYWLGFFYADGYITHSDRNWECSIELQVGDLGHLKKLNKSVCGNVQPSIKRKKRNYIDKEYDVAFIRFYSKKMFNDLKEHGCVERKSDKIQMPNLIKELIWHFLRGFFDGDGCLVLNKSRNALKCDFCSSSIVMLNQIKEFLYSEGIYSYINLQQENRGVFKSTMPNYRLYISGLENSLIFCQKLYDNANIYLDRKFDKYHRIVRDYNIIERIEAHRGPRHKC